MSRLADILRKAPMPIRESVLDEDAWHEAYDKWWHDFASEAAIAKYDVLNPANGLMVVTKAEFEGLKRANENLRKKSDL